MSTSANTNNQASRLAILQAVAAWNDDMAEKVGKHGLQTDRARYERNARVCLNQWSEEAWGALAVSLLKGGSK